jgi:hypothetical protein
MSWKNVKDHYRIGHIVQVREGKICIGSAYVSDLIMVSFDGEVSWGPLGPSKNDEHARYHSEMTSDLAKLRELIEAPDSFANAIPVYTYDGGDILEKQCEALGWPHVTHDGCLQYENTFSADRTEVIEWAKRNAKAGIELWDKRIVELNADIAKAMKWRARDAADLQKLDSLTNTPGI